MYRNCNWNWYWHWNNTFSVYFYILFFYSKTKQDIAKCFGVELVEHTETRSKKNKKIKFWILDFGFWILNFGFWIFWKRQNQKTKKTGLWVSTLFHKKKFWGDFWLFFGGGTPPPKKSKIPQKSPKKSQIQKKGKIWIRVSTIFRTFFLFIYIFLIYCYFFI